MASAPASKPRQANVLERLGGERNCGRKTIDEIKRWMDQVSEVNLVEQAAIVGRAA
jgi:DNA-directed RNA polymerase subunit N (RpoN/RPB10)